MKVRLDGMSVVVQVGSLLLHGWPESRLTFLNMINSVTLYQVSYSMNLSFLDTNLELRR